ncbi:MAG: nucleotidyltransferase domain-containing protein [Clostridium sp.]|nr:nucleotidyltransferase domain-containing protein [Clostridium sp.]
MERKEIVKQISKAIHQILPGVPSFLYGSEARGEAKDGSDFDVIVILDDDKEGKEFAINEIRISECLYDIELENGVEISPLVVLRSMREKLRTPFTLNVNYDAIPL